MAVVWITEGGAVVKVARAGNRVPLGPESMEQMGKLRLEKVRAGWGPHGDLVAEPGPALLMQAPHVYSRRRP